MVVEQYAIEVRDGDMLSPAEQFEVQLQLITLGYSSAHAREIVRKSFHTGAATVKRFESAREATSTIARMPSYVRCHFRVVRLVP